MPGQTKWKSDAVRLAATTFRNVTVVLPSSAITVSFPIWSILSCPCENDAKAEVENSSVSPAEKSVITSFPNAVS